MLRIETERGGRCLHRNPISKYDGRVGERIDDRDLYGGMIRLHVLHHAAAKPIYGHWMIEELRRHGYAIGPGTMYPLLHGLAGKGYLRSKQIRIDNRFRKVYRITPAGRHALRLARRRVQELFGEMFSRHPSY